MYFAFTGRWDFDPTNPWHWLWGILLLSIWLITYKKPEHSNHKSDKSDKP